LLVSHCPIDVSSLTGAELIRNGEMIKVRPLMSGWFHAVECLLDQNANRFSVQTIHLHKL
jgi:hypothetical protein